MPHSWGSAQTHLRWRLHAAMTVLQFLARQPTVNYIQQHSRIILHAFYMFASPPPPSPPPLPLLPLPLSPSYTLTPARALSRTFQIVFALVRAGARSFFHTRVAFCFFFFLFFSFFRFAKYTISPLCVCICMCVA